MKIVNDTGANIENILNGSMVFEAELFHSGINPKILFFKDTEGNTNLNFKNWDTLEAIDSVTPDQAEEMVSTLVEAINFARHYVHEQEDLFTALYNQPQEITNVQPNGTNAGDFQRG